MALTQAVVVVFPSKAFVTGRLASLVACRPMRPERRHS
jgi:hypothetical protein